MATSLDRCEHLAFQLLSLGFVGTLKASFYGRKQNLSSAIAAPKILPSAFDKDKAFRAMQGMAGRVQKHACSAGHANDHSHCDDLVLWCGPPGCMCTRDACTTKSTIQERTVLPGASASSAVPWALSVMCPKSCEPFEALSQICANIRRLSAQERMSSVAKARCIRTSSARKRVRSGLIRRRGTRSPGSMAL